MHKNLYLSLFFGVTIGILLGIIIKTNLHEKKDHVIIRVLLTYHRDALGHNLDPNKLYEDGKRWLNKPQYNAVEYP